MDSVLHQKYTDIEYIVVDGASTDDTLSIVKKYESVFQGRLRFLSEADNGIYDAMNKGIRMATGDVIGFLNSDDFYSSDDVLQVVADSFDNNDIDAVYGDIHYVNSDDLKKCVRYYSSAPFHRSFMRFGYMPAHPSFYCKKACYEKFGGFDTSFKIAADFENLLRFIFLRKIKTHYVKKDFVTMRVGGVSNASFASRKMIMKEHLRAMKKNGIYSNFFLLTLRYFYKIYELIRW